MNSKLVSKWYTTNDVFLFVAEAQPGDKMEFKRGFFSHYAIYLGNFNWNGKKDYYIIHVTTTEGNNAGHLTAISLSSANRSTTIQKNIGEPYVESLLDYLCSIPPTCFRINNEKDKKWSPFRPWQIIQRAKRAMNSWKDYDLWANNCEHFVNYCRYDMKQSDQSDTAFFGTVISVLGAGALLLLGMLGGSQRS